MVCSSKVDYGAELLLILRNILRMSELIYHSDRIKIPTDFSDDVSNITLPSSPLLSFSYPFSGDYAEGLKQLIIQVMQY